MTDHRLNHPEPLPPASELAVTAFLSALQGYIELKGGSKALRLTLQRAMAVDGKRYLQQLSEYLGEGGKGGEGGRIFPVTTGAMGEAYRLKRIVRTKDYPDEASLKADIAADMTRLQDERSVEDVALSYLAIPVLDRSGEEAVAIVYADTKAFNFFAEDEHVANIRAMTETFARFVDRLNESAIPRIRNFPLPPGVEVAEEPTIFRSVQEALESPAPPSFRTLSSFNFEIVA
jgi:hypothetical protein